MYYDALQRYGQRKSPRDFPASHRFFGQPKRRLLRGLWSRQTLSRYYAVPDMQRLPLSEMLRKNLLDPPDLMWSELRRVAAVVRCRLDGLKEFVHLVVYADRAGEAGDLFDLGGEAYLADC